MSAATIEAPARSASKKKQKVQHWFWKKELEAANRVPDGAVLIAMCGRAQKCGGKGAVPLVTIEVVGLLMAQNAPQDCKSCVRAYEAHLRRAGRRRDRWDQLNGL